MALTIDQSGITALGFGGNPIADVTGPGGYVFAADLGNFDGCLLRFTWTANIGGSNPVIYTDDVTVDVATIDGYVTPPRPIAIEGSFGIELVSGAPTGDLKWAIYKL